MLAISDFDPLSQPIPPGATAFHVSSRGFGIQHASSNSQAVQAHANIALGDNDGENYYPIFDSLYLDEDDGIEKHVTINPLGSFGPFVLAEVIETGGKAASDNESRAVMARHYSSFGQRIRIGVDEKGIFDYAGYADGDLASVRFYEKAHSSITGILEGEETLEKFADPSQDYWTYVLPLSQIANGPYDPSQESRAVATNYFYTNRGWMSEWDAALVFAHDAKATASNPGSIQLGFQQTGKSYPVMVDAEGRAYVEVPWTDTAYTLPTVSDEDFKSYLGI